MIFDTHAHLDDSRFDRDRKELIEGLKAQGISLIVNPGADMPSSKRAVELAKQYDFIYAAVGVHPHDVKDMGENTIDELRKLASEEKVVAIGEIGLDFYYDNSPRDLQLEYFIKQIELANELSLPIIIHSRDASELTYETIKKYKADTTPCVLHCFSQSLEMAERYVDLGCYISFAGPITFKNAHNLKEAATKLPLDRLFIETDCPYLTPEPFRGKRNDPSKVIYVAKEIAKLKGISEQEVIDATRKNATKFFGINQ